jgi:DNA-binding MarR family transcriptional regulator
LTRRPRYCVGQRRPQAAGARHRHPYGPTSPESTLYDRLRRRGLVDPGTGATWEALETRGLVICRYTPTADGGRLLEIKLTAKGRKLVRTATGEIRPPTRKKGQLRPRQWAALVQLSTAGAAGLPAPEMDRQFDWWSTSLRLRNLGFMEEYMAPPTADQRYWRRITAAGQAQVDDLPGAVSRGGGTSASH